MEPTICEDDLVVLNREVSELTYGDIVVCHYEGDKDLKPFNEIYRIVGLPGDSIAVEGDIDSRYFGPMSQEQILGKVIKVMKR